MINLFSNFRIFLFSLLAVSSIIAGAEECCFSQALCEIKTGYFVFTNSKMRKVYDKGGWDIQLSASYPLWKTSNNWIIHSYFAIEYFYRSGKSINGQQETSIWSVPINAGLKPIYVINSHIQYYFAIGPRLFNIHQHNCSSHVYENYSRNSLGLFANTGFNYLLCDRIAIDIFGEYSYAKMRVPCSRPGIYTRDLQVGGCSFGGGLVYQF